MFVKPKLCSVIFVILLAMLSITGSFAQDIPEYDEMALFLDVPDLGGQDMDVLIKGDEVYLPITDLFDFLKIRNISTPGLDTISGFFISQDKPYLIDRINNRIQFGDKVFELKPGDLIRTETNLFLRGTYFGQIFGLECQFSFRTLSVRINTRLELPAIREMRLEAMRKNINRLAGGEEEADTTMGRDYPFFHFGMADWSANVTEDLDGDINSRLGLALGSIIAGGEATVGLNYNSYTPLTEKQQYYLWRYVDNDNKAVKQVMAGKISTGATSSIYDPVVGAQITNTSTKFRRSFGTYTLSDYTEPNWIVELYVNNVLVDYTSADASGFFTFEVPLVYGNTNVMLKFYGPYGEERTRVQNITIPFNFIPEKKLEYNVSAGMVEDNQHSKFSRGSLHYGLSRAITIGSGVEYLSSVTSGQIMPFVNGSCRLASNLLLSGEYSPEVRSKGTLSYRLPSSLQFDLNYVYYTPGQTAINNNFRQERKFSVSMPFRFTNLSLYNRLSMNELVLPSSDYTTYEWLISGVMFGVSTNITSYAVYVGDAKPFYYSDFSLSFRLPGEISIQPRAQYTYTDGKFLSAKLLTEKRIFKKGYLTASYEQNFRSNLQLLEFGFRYDFKFARTSFTARQTDRFTTFTQYVSGSIINDSKTNYVYTDYRTNVGRGGISIIPFLDKNANGTREPGEPKVWGLNLRTNSGRIEKRESDSTIRIFGLEPYTNCFIEFDQSSLDNIAWRLKDHSMNVAVDPNMVKLIEIPINIVGEAAGTVFIAQKGSTRGLGRVIVNFYDKDQKRIGRTLSEPDGYFSFFGLYPGTYEVRIDSAQMHKLQMFASPSSRSFRIQAYLDGDYVDSLDFIVRPDTLKQPEPPARMQMIVHEQTGWDSIGAMNNYAIGINFESGADADSLRDRFSKLTGKSVVVVPVDNQYKVYITGIESMEAAEEFYPELQSIGIHEISLIIPPGELIETRLLAIIPGTETDTVKSIIGKDTVLLVVQKIEPDQITTANNQITIETRKFEKVDDARELRDRLSTLTGKEVVVVPVDGQYKVSISGFTSKAEAEAFYPVIQSKGIEEISLIAPRELIDTRLLAIIPGTEADTVKSIIGKDTALLVVQKIEPDQITTANNQITIETRNFEKVEDARELRDRLSTLTGKEVVVVPVDGQYKVSISGFTSKAEAEAFYPVIQSKGIEEISLIAPREEIGLARLEDKSVIEMNQDTGISEKEPPIVVIHNIVEEDSTSSIDHYAIQLGAFKREQNAYKLRKKLTDMLDKEVAIRVENDFNKVRIMGFRSNYEVERYIPELIKQGEREIWVITLKGTRKPDLVAGEPDIHREILHSFTDKDSTMYVIHNVYEDTLTTGPVTYTIQLGAFNRKINADALRTELATILGRKVEIIVEDNLYKVNILGFRTKEEAEAYMPVLRREGVSEINILPLKSEHNYRRAISRLDTINGSREKQQLIDSSYLVDQAPVRQTKKPVSDSTIIVNKAIAPEKTAEERTSNVLTEKTAEETEVGATTLREDIEPRNFGDERRKTLEERLLEAEYRSGLYESRWPGVEFTIQIAASKSIGDPEVIKQKFGISSEIKVDKADEWYRFTVGRYIKFWKAREYRNILMTTKGLDDAFIVAFKDGKKIMLNDLLAFVESMPDAEKEKSERQAMINGFSIQVLATKDGNISASDIRKKFDIDEDIFVEYNESDGLYRYTVGNYNTYPGAAKVRNKLRASGFRDAFVVGYKDGNRVKDLNSIF